MKVMMVRLLVSNSHKVMTALIVMLYLPSVVEEIFLCNLIDMICRS
jgi:hypothetical protein